MGKRHKLVRSVCVVCFVKFSVYTRFVTILLKIGKILFFYCSAHRSSIIVIEKREKFISNFVKKIYVYFMIFPKRNEDLKKKKEMRDALAYIFKMLLNDLHKDILAT